MKLFSMIRVLGGFFTMGLFFLLLLSGTEESSSQEKGNSYQITSRCMGVLCLGEKIEDVRGREKVFFVEDEHSTDFDSHIDSVLFIECRDSSEVLAYSRISLSRVDTNTIIRMLVTKSSKLRTALGIHVGMSFQELQKIIPYATFKRRSYEPIGSGQVITYIRLQNGGKTMFVIDYDEVITYGDTEADDTRDTVVTSILIYGGG